VSVTKRCRNPAPRGSVFLSTTPLPSCGGQHRPRHEEYKLKDQPRLHSETLPKQEEKRRREGERKGGRGGKERESEIGFH
jgi:hypothetical protein